MGKVEDRGFTLIELLVVISITSLLMGILVPVLGKVRREARAMQGMSNQKEIASALNLFAEDNDQRYPESVAFTATERIWNWSDPTRLISSRARTAASRRAMSSYLGTYLPEASTVYCPSAPHKYRYLQQAWDAGEDWNHPDTDETVDGLGGTYCFYWNYRGFLTERNAVFRGPTGPASGGRRYSKLLVTDYFGYNHYNMPGAFASCEPFRGAGVTPETSLLSAYWSRRSPAETTPEFKLRAAYTDGHVETYRPSEVTPMKLSSSQDGSVPARDLAGTGYGTFFLPTRAVQ